MKNIVKIAPYCFVMLFYFLLSINIPLTGDDWTWKSHRGMERLGYFFKDYNGRYLSNIIEIGLVRIDIVRYFTLTVVSFGIIFIINRIVFKKPTGFTFLLTFVLFMFMPIKIFAQTLGWTAGYVNYVISIFLLLLYIYYDKFLKHRNSPIFILLVFFLAISTQLLVEHITLYAVLLAVAILVKDKVISKRFSCSGIAYFLGSVIGAVIMFTNSAYVNIFNKEDDYRTVGSEEGIFVKMIEVFSNQMQKYLFVENYVIIIMISILSLYILHKRKSVLNTIVEILIWGYMLFITLYRTYIVEHILPDSTVNISSIFTVLFILCLFVVMYSLIRIEKSESSYELMSYGISAVIVSAPFLVLTPYGGRAALATYVFMVMGILKVLDNSLNVEIEKFNKYIATAAVVISLYYMIPIMENGEVDRERLKIVEEADFKGNDKITLPGIPNKQFHQMPDPAENVYMTQFYKKVYGIPDEVEIIIKNEKK